MNDDALRTTSAFMRENWHLVTDDESKFKTEFASRARPWTAAALAGERDWSEVLRKHRKDVSHLLGWRVADQLAKLTKACPGCLGEAVPALLARHDADDFWDAIARSIGEAKLAEYDKLRSAGARASVASLFLFLHDPHRFPVYRTRNFGGPLKRLTGDPLDASTPGTLLASYYAGISRLSSRFVEEGLPVESPLDTQGVLWIVNYKNVIA